MAPLGLPAVTDNPDIRHEDAKMLGHFTPIEVFPCPAE
jgi:hypothetical protein